MLFLSFLFCLLIFYFFIESSLTTPLAFEKHFLMEKRGLYGFDSFCLQILIEFMFFISLLFFLYPNKKLNEYRSQCPSTEAYVIINVFDIFNCYLTVFTTLKLIVFQNLGQIFFSFCLIVTAAFYRVVPYLFWRNSCFV